MPTVREVTSRLEPVTADPFLETQTRCTPCTTNREGPMEIELTHCPACGRPAEIFDRFVVFGDRGPIEHVKIRCISGPSFERRVGRWNPGAPPPSTMETYHDRDSGP